MEYFNFTKKAIITVLVFSIISGLGVFIVPKQSSALTEAEIQIQEAKLRAEYDELQKDIEKWQGILSTTRNKANSIEGDISVLNAKIREAELTIRAKNIAIQQISKEINNKSEEINDLENRIDKGKQSLGQIIRKTDELDSYSLVEVMLAGRNLSDFFIDADSFSTIKKSLRDKFFEILEVKAETEEEKENLAKKKNSETDAKFVVEDKKKVIAKSEAEKKQLLNVTKEQERAYADVLAERQKRAAQISAALFSLRDTDGIPFGQALQYAKVAEKSTGVRSALVLAILTQESDLGKNQGSCLVTNIDTGDGKGKNTGTFFEKVMKSPRDTAPFKNITDRLGRDWSSTPVSCPPGYAWAPSRGYGGGMGPSQFIPSTWELFKGKIGGVFGISADQANPWNPQHAITATSIYLSDLGARSGSYTAERDAACRYYSGSKCTPGRQPSNIFYGDQVMSKVQEIQENIDFLDNV